MSIGLNLTGQLIWVTAYPQNGQDPLELHFEHIHVEQAATVLQGDVVF